MLKMILSRAEYLKHLKIQRYYLQKYCSNYASTNLKCAIKQLLDIMDSEIILYETSIKKSQERFKQCCLDFD